MKTVVNRFRYALSNRLGVLQVQPLGESNFAIEWAREDDGKLDYKKTLPSKVTFTGAAYANLLKIEKSIYRCDYESITVERLCGSSWVAWFSGRFSNNASVWDLDRCQVEVKVDDINTEQCYEDNKGKEINLLTIPTRRTVLINPGNVTIQAIELSDNNCSNAPVNGDAMIAEYYERYWQHFEHYTPGDPECITTTGWAREIITVPCGTLPPGPDWQLLLDTCPGGDKTYARPARIFGCQYTGPVVGANPQVSDYLCSIVGASTTSTQIDNGLSLNSVIDLFISTFCPGLTFISNFFQINPDVVSSINYVTGQPSKTRFITIFQKSDVKRPSISGNATKALFNWEKLFDTLIKMFNLRWRIVGNVIRMEHVSFFSKTIGIDLTQSRWAPFMVGKNKYTYQVQEIPGREIFRFMEAGVNSDFEGRPIIYSGGCVSNNSQDKTYAIDKVTTDVDLCLNNPEPDSKVVSDDGFVFIACDYDGTNYYIITEAQILGGSTLNNSLAWAQLHRDYHKWDRPLKNGTMNDQLTTFFSVKPTKKGEKITIPLCCGDTFSPDDFVKTMFGNGIVDKATFNFKGETLELDLLYPADQGLTSNTAPVAVNNTAITYVDTAIIIDILANDSDPDIGGVLGMPFIVIPPMHGTVIVLSNGTIQYTPDAGYIGDDYVSYKVVDDWSEPSNTALIAITVRPLNTAPIANNESYIAAKNTVLNISAPGVFANDSDDVSFVLDIYDATSVHGGAVILNTDGSFNYTPATGFVGIDTFTYRIKDTPGLTGLATVTIDVRDPNNPVANDDGLYTTRKNTNLTVLAPGVLVNDTTGVGTLTAASGAFTTAQGGTFTIASDGSFTYAPPAGYSGLDSVTYTASNGTGTDTATVSFRVLPDIFARLQMLDTEFNSFDGQCLGEDFHFGEENLCRVRTFFYSNSAGTIPLDVSSLGLDVNVLVTHHPFGGGTTTSTVTETASGTQYDLFGADVIYYHYTTNCAGAIQPGYVDDNYTLNPGNYTII